MLLGAIAGDIVGSVYEGKGKKTKSWFFPLLKSRSRCTDDTIMTVAVASSLLNDREYGMNMRDFGRRFPGRGYGGNFGRWLHSDDPTPYNSWGNGSAMRASPVGLAFGSIEETLEEAEASAAPTHNHPEGVKGAQATALAAFLGRTGSSKATIRAEVARRFGYELGASVPTIRPSYAFDVSCQGTVPAAIIAFLDSWDVGSAIRNAVSLGGDSDTLACIAGGIAHAYYGELGDAIIGGEDDERHCWSSMVDLSSLRESIPDELLTTVDEFIDRYPVTPHAGRVEDDPQQDMQRLIAHAVQRGLEDPRNSPLMEAVALVDAEGTEGVDVLAAAAVNIAVSTASEDLTSLPCVRLELDHARDLLAQEAMRDLTEDADSETSKMLRWVCQTSTPWSPHELVMCVLRDLSRAYGTP